MCIRDSVHVVGHAADDIARLIPVKIAHRQRHELRKDVAPHPVRDPAADAHHPQVYKEGHEIAEQISGCLLYTSSGAG